MNLPDGIKDNKILPKPVITPTNYNTTPFVKLSIKKVVHTLIEAIILVFVVLLVFLQNLRATFIPMVFFGCQRIDRHHLSPVLGHNRFGHAAFGSCRH